MSAALSIRLPRRARWWSGLAGLVTFVGVACNSGGEVATESRQAGFEVGAGPTLTIKLQSGAVRITGGPEGKLTVDATLRDPSRVQYAATQTGDGISIESTVAGMSVGDVASFRVNRGVDLAITAPSKTTVSIETLTGAIELRSIEASVEGHTGGGAITIVDASGEVTFDTARGDVSVQRFRGSLNVESGSGDVDILETSGGVAAKTSYGRVTFRGELLSSDGHNQLETADGRMFVTLLKANDLRVEASASTVRLKAPAGFSTTTQTDSRVVGTLGAGNVPVALRAANGTLDLEIVN